MSRHLVSGTARDTTTGQVRASTTIEVYLAGTTTPASVYAASTGGTAVNSVLTDTNGYFSFYVDEADYALTQRFKILSVKTGYDTVTYDNLSFFSLTCVDTDGTLAANSDKKLATQKAVKTYADTKTTLAAVKADADVASAISLKHAAVTVSAPIKLSGQAISLVNDADATITEIDTGALANSDTKVPTSKTVTDAISAVSTAAAKSLPKSLYIPSLQDGMYGAFKAGWEPFWFNQQWGGAPWVDNLVDGATGEAYTFQGLTGNVEMDNSFAFGYDNTYYYLTQKFKVSKAVTIAAVWVKLLKTGNPVGDFSFVIQGDTGGAPDGSTIANGTTNTINGTLITSNTVGGWYRFVFATPPTFAANTLYHLRAVRSDANSTTNYVSWCLNNTAGEYPHGEAVKGTNVPAWAAQTGKDCCFIVEPVTNMLTDAGQFEGKITFSEGSPLDQSEAMTQPLNSSMLDFDVKEGTISIVGGSWTKDKTIWDAQYGLDHDRIVLRCNVTTGYPQVDLYDKTGTLHTVTGTTDISAATVRRITVAYRAKNDGADFLKLYVNATSEGSPITGASITFDPLMKELGNMSLGGGYALAPTWTKDSPMTVIPTSDGYTYDGTATEAAHSVVSGGKLAIQIVGSTDTCFWHIHPTLNNTNGWEVVWKHSVKKAADITMEFECTLQIDDATKQLYVLFHTYYLEMSYDTATAVNKVQLDMTKEHVFKAVGKGSDFYLYCDGKLVVDGTGLMVTASGTARLSFGDADATAGSNAESIWDYIKYYETASLPPQFTAGILSEFSYFSGDQTGLLAALYNSGTLKSVKELCGVGRNYIDVGERVIENVNITASPTYSGTWALAADLECFVYGKDIDILGQINGYHSQAGYTSASVLPKLDGGYSHTLNTDNTAFAEPTANYQAAAIRSHKFNVPFGLHKAEIYNTAGGAGTQTLFSRSIKVISK